LSTNIIGIRNNNTIVPYSAATKRTKQVDLTVTGTNWTTSKALGVAYADSSGNWRLTFNIMGTVTATPSITLSVTGVLFSSTTDFYQACASQLTDSGAGLSRTPQVAITLNNTDDILINSESGDFTRCSVSGDVALKEKPSWADANMEGVTAVDVYIAPASASAAGLLSYYEEGSTVLTASGFTTTVTGTSYWVRINNVVNLVIPSFGGTSNSTSFSLYGLPSKLHPLRNQDFVFHYAFDNGVAAYNVIARKNNGDGITLYKAAFDGWTNSGAKSIPGLNMSYILT